MSGTLSNRGPAAVNAEATAIGIYTRKVTIHIERRWHIFRRQKGDYVTYGNMRIRFDVNKKGQTQNVRVLSSDANPIMADFTLSAILGAKVDPMPAEVVRELALANGLLEITYDVIIY